MPHVIVEYSDNITDIDTSALLLEINTALFNTQLFQHADDIKARAYVNSPFLIGLNNSRQGYIFVRLYLLSGRSLHQKQQLSDLLLTVLQQSSHFRAGGLTVQLCVDIAEMEQRSYAKQQFTSTP